MEHRIANQRRCRASSIQRSRPEFIKAYEELLNHLDADEAVLFVDAVRIRRMRCGLSDAGRRKGNTDCGGADQRSATP